MKNYGLIIEPFDTTSDYLGGTSLSLEAKYGAEELVPDGDWSPYTPSTENQDTKTGDTFACVSFGTTNAIEMLARRRFGQASNLSDRFLAVMSGTQPGKGNSPKTVADYLKPRPGRDCYWTVNEKDWPDVDTVEEYYYHPPTHLKQLAVALGAEFEFGYQYITNSPSSIKTALKSSPVCIAVTAWVEQDGVYVRGPFKENHWTTIIKVLPNGNYQVFDSFAPFFKEVHPSACQSVAMGYYLNRNVVRESAWTKFLKLILDWFTDPQTAREPEPTPPPTTPPAPEPTPQPASDEKLIAALIQVESEGNDWAIGDKHLANKAYGPLQIRKPYCDDVNTHFGTAYVPQRCLGDRKLSIEIFRKYMSIYATEKRLGRKPTDEDKARMHNAGPTAWKPGTKMHTASALYWYKVKRYLDTH